MKRLLTTQDVATLLGCTIRQARRLLQRIARTDPRAVVRDGSRWKTTARTLARNLPDSALGDGT